MIRLYTLGHLSLQNEDGASIASVLAQPKRLALLVYLAAVHPTASSSRDTLVALLWPELDDAHARTALRQALYLLRRSVDARLIVSTGDERLGVDPARLLCDVLAFEAARERGDPAAALAFYRGPFLEGFHLSEAPEFERWLERQRHRLEREAIACAWHLAERAEAEGDRPGCRRWAERALELGPDDEESFRRYLAILERHGDATAAVTAFAAYQRRLAEDLGLEPAAETAALVERIRAARVAIGHRKAGPPVIPRVPVPPLAPPSPHPEPAPPSNGAGTSEQIPVARLAQRLPRGWRWVVGAAALVALAGGARLVRSLELQATASRRQSIAVLPFRNLSPDSSNAYFAAGLHDELLSQLARVSSLRVVGRTSVNSYRQTTKSPSQIAGELGVGRIVEGTVQIVGNRLRVVVDLLDPLTGQNLWVEHYERTLDDAFDVQSEVAERIVIAVGARLTGAEASAIRTPPTQDAAAYQLYLQGIEYGRRPGTRREDALAAEQLYERALALDSTFAPAHAALAIIHWLMYHLGQDTSPARLALARREAEAAGRLAPGLPQAHLAIGVARYETLGDYRGALNEFKLGLRAAPSDADLWGALGGAYRSLGQWDSAFAAFDHARTIEPRDAGQAFSVGSTYHYLHRYPEAIEAYRQALALAPDFTQAHVALAWSYVLWKGQLDTLRAVLQAVPVSTDPGAGGASIFGQRLILLLWDRQADSLLATLRATRGAELMTPLDRALMTAQAQTLRGDTVAARVAYNSALVPLDSAVRAAPDDWGFRGVRGIVLAKVGRRTEALRDARWLEQVPTDRNDRFRDGWVIGARGSILVAAGEWDAALVEIERQLLHPSLVTVHILRLAPDYDPIREDPRFQALLRKYARPAPVQ